MSLRFRTVSEIGTPPPIEWVWENRIARGYVTMLGGAGGVGKSALVASLEVAVLSGQMFLGGGTIQGPIIHGDFDTDARAQIPWLERAVVGQGVSRDVLQHITYVDSESGGFMDEAGLAALRAHAIETGAVLIVIDAFTSAFPMIRGNDAGEVMQVMAAFRALAKETNAAVVILDHTPKPMANMPEGRGLLGSTIKSAGARAVHLLSRVKPSEVGGQDVLKLEAHKNNLAAVGEPVGVLRVWEGDGLRFELYELPDADQNMPSTKARKALEAYLDDRAGTVIPRKELFDQIITRLNVSERTVKRAMAEVVSDGAAQVIALHGRGNPVGYKSVLEPADPGPLDSLTPPDSSVEVLAPNQNSVSDSILFDSPPDLKSPVGPKSFEEERW
ncbi:AAA family ATPase [Deinococcus marmoris]|uniref:AAA family ATPase n=1 Tax=Deinococcus marmoris TaxID=249408 RepID=UPI000497AFA5|nr:AAA family ATPase [Deinococcus marmoris]